MTISKSDLRKLVRERENALTPEERQKSDGVLTGRFLAAPEYRSAAEVFLYLGVGCEPDTRPILEDALKSGKRVALPKITAPGIMEAREIQSLAELVPGKFGIPEPRDSCPVIPPERFDLILVPGAAFTPDGKRLGRGGGYYDRYLPRTRGVKIALARRELVFHDLPAREHDISMDILITA